MEIKIEDKLLFDSPNLNSQFGISKNKDDRVIKTEAGNFIFNKNLFDMMIQNIKITPENIRYDLAQYFKKNINSNMYEIHEQKLADKISYFFKKKRIESESFLDEHEYYIKESKALEVFNTLTPEIKHLALKSKLFNKFKFDIDRMTYFEHQSVGGSFKSFFCHPFMSGISQNKEKILKIRELRENDILKEEGSQNLNLPFQTGFPLYIEGNSYLLNDRAVSQIRYTETYTPMINFLEKSNQTKSKNLLSRIYLNEFPKDENKFDYVRLCMNSTQYNDNLEAFPISDKLQFFDNKKLIGEITDKNSISKFEVKQEDIKFTNSIFYNDKWVKFELIKINDMDYIANSTTDSENWIERYYTRVCRKIL